MSYLNNLRLIFAGDFQADVPTANNDVRNFNDQAFEQDLLNPTQDNWNPSGSGAFRLINCRVTAVYYQDGSSTTDAAVDPVVGLVIDGADNRVSAKMTDLDPQAQLVSMIWGLKIRLSDGNQPNFFAGAFEPTAVRDVLFGRWQSDQIPPPSTASATFQSVLTDVKWSDRLPNSRFLQELKAATANQMMSVKLTTFGFDLIPSSNRYTLGTVIGAIAPYFANEPRSFVLGRRIVPMQNGRTEDNINFFDCSVEEKTRSVFADLGNALPITDMFGKVKDIGDLQLALLTDEAIQESQLVVETKDFIRLGGLIPYREPNWLCNTGGIWSIVNLSPEILSLVQQKPLALIKMTNQSEGKVAIRESLEGLLIRADNFVQRVEVGDKININLFAARYGQRLANKKVIFSVRSPQESNGGIPLMQDDRPKTTPDINTPASAIPFSPTTTTNASGQAVLSITSTNPNNPRKYIDGQIYEIEYQLEGQSKNQQQFLDLVFLLLFDEYNIPSQPTWINHIQPIFQQYANLYPIMSQRLFNLADYEAVKQNRAILELAFSLDFTDPNYMPVTRNLSRAKQQTILKWLRQKNLDGTYALVYADS
jgi:hypothetical protein